MPRGGGGLGGCGRRVPWALTSSATPVSARDRRLGTMRAPPCGTVPASPVARLNPYYRGELPLLLRVTLMLSWF